MGRHALAPADVCIGVAVATGHLIYPQAVGGEGCGMLAVALDAEAACPQNPGTAGRVLADLGRAVPARRRNRREVIQQPEEEAAEGRLSDASLRGCG